MTLPDELTLADAWALVLELAERCRRGEPISSRVGLSLDASGRLREVDPDDAWLVARPDLESGWEAGRCAFASTERAEIEQLLELYVPLCIGSRAVTLTVAHIAQSLDGRIATWSGSSQFITGKENLLHAHRLRALFDAIVVGANTVQYDDPQLTTRLAAGPNPTRVVLDPRLRLGGDFKIFADGQAPSLVLHGKQEGLLRERVGQADCVAVELVEGHLSIRDIIAQLRARGLRRIMIEGGGSTISRFLQAGALDRLQVAIAPVIIGSGRQGFSLPLIDRLSDALRLRSRRFLTGSDVLFDCILESGASPAASA